MTGVETIARIRFEHFQNRKGIKRIARELGLARDTVRKVLRSQATEFSYKRTTQPAPKLGPWVDTLTAILEAEANRPKRPMPSAPPDTPYQRARQVWDDRMGLAIGHARNWRLMAFANLGVAAFLGLGWWAQAARATVKPYVVEVASWGQTQKITALDGVYHPKDAEIAYALSRWISDVRSKSVDPVVVKSDWLAAYDLTTPKSAAFLNDWAEAHDPFKDVGRSAVSVEVQDVVRRSDDTYDVQWRETRFLDGQKANEERWRALITLKLQPPADEAELMKNPLGIRIEDVSWTPDAA